MLFMLACIKDGNIRLFPVMYASTSKVKVERFHANSFDGTNQLFIGFVAAKVVNPKFKPESGKKVWYVCDETEYKEIHYSGFEISEAVGVLYSHLGQGPNEEEWHKKLRDAFKAARATHYDCTISISGYLS